MAAQVIQPVSNLTKVLTPEEVFAAIDWTDRKSIITCFPVYMQEQLASKKSLSKAVNIENFDMKTPYGDAYLLKDTELKLEPSKRQVLFGANATGKSMLFHNMSNGKIKDFPKHISMHHCKELENDELHDTVLNTVVNAHPFRNILLKCEAKLKELVESGDAEKLDAWKDNLNWITFQIRTIKGDTTVERAKKMLRVLGFDETGQGRLVTALSGGLRMRVALCMAFMIEPDLLLLDEPTNHLDFPSVLWLENRLRGYPGSFLMVSHDRELLNNVCGSVLLLEDKQIKYYPMGFKEFEKKKALEDKKKFEEIEKFLIKNQNVDPSTFLGKQKADKKAWSDSYYQKQIALAGKFTFPTSTPLDNPENLAPEDISLIKVNNVTFSYNPAEGVFIFGDPISFNVTASTRVGVMGPNGAGKSTFLKLLTKKIIATTGEIITHPNFQLAYFGQHSTAELDLENTPAEFMGKSFPGVAAGILRQHLAKTSVVGQLQDTRMKALSFSQRSCIVFAKLTFVCPHLLILDEPTNFLDLESVDSLIAACNKYKGALLLVSHNRDFLKKCATHYLSVVPGQFLLFDSMKKAEQATYTFINEMEDGASAGAIKGQAASALSAGGGTVHASQKGANFVEVEEKKQDADGGFVFSGTIAAAPKPKPAAAAAAGAEKVFTEKDKIQALWTDGKWYGASIKKVDVAAKKYTVLYTEYGNTAAVPFASVRAAVAAAPAAAGAKAAPAAGAKAPAAGAKAGAKK
jgi:ATPase subunit of ABC transporter with duplicated ATPase domains